MNISGIVVRTNKQVTLHRPEVGARVVTSAQTRGLGCRCIDQTFGVLGFWGVVREDQRSRSREKIRIGVSGAHTRSLGCRCKGFGMGSRRPEVVETEARC
ncbi:hypothetical protein U1Q18_006158 [Sarracenia purpurea var. burkii]